MKKVLIRARGNKYGKNLYDPQCELTRLMAELRDRQTLSFENIRALSDIGYAIEYVGDRVAALDEIKAQYLGIK